MNSGKDKWWIGAIALIGVVVWALTSYLTSSTNNAALAPPTDSGKIAASTTVPPKIAATAAPANEAQAAPAQQAATPSVTVTDYGRAHYDPIHFKPAIDKATDADCLKCHQEVLDTNTRDASPAGLKKVSTLAWYQTLDTYDGEQMTFHQRHLTAPFIKKVATMSCTTCHQGNNPRDEVSNTAADSPTDLTMRKMVDPNTCLMCHGQFPYQNMGLPGPWHESGAAFQNNCLLCHAAIRTTRHKVNFLNAAGIEQEGVANSDSCYGCHGGRAWYRTSFPYPRHAWAGAGATVPDWAKDRPTESDLRFLIEGSKP
ncbi:hypothetical protein SAMN05660964_02344 [Thiothrix caldifontis]|uniref:Uncharacterized protein n=1 Tax=Thiothrix caldifontis TaxID=525918 RepID=A0A1H4DPH3_9GAMM|nr:hypothetical protein [Thiothrix caldifontis]SEA74665.1 hypothetical protein SAMN05660964_02344 [Thiothrix caldifontis]